MLSKRGISLTVDDQDSATLSEITETVDMPLTLMAQGQKVEQRPRVLLTIPQALSRV